MLCQIRETKAVRLMEKLIKLSFISIIVCLFNVINEIKLFINSTNGSFFYLLTVQHFADSMHNRPLISGRTHHSDRKVGTYITCKGTCSLFKQKSQCRLINTYNVPTYKVYICTLYVQTYIMYINIKIKTQDSNITRCNVARTCNIDSFFFLY